MRAILRPALCATLIAAAGPLFAVESGTADAPAFTPAQLAAAPTDGWFTNGGSLSNERYSPLSLLDRSNVAQLKANWRASLNGSGLSPRAGNQAQPIVFGNSIYLMTGEGDTFSVDIDSGKVNWEYKANVDSKLARPCCGWPGRGVALGEGKVFVGLLDSRLVALDQHTGAVVWSIQAEDPQGRILDRRSAAVLRRAGHHRVRRQRPGHPRSPQGL